MWSWYVRHRRLNGKHAACRRHSLSARKRGGQGWLGKGGVEAADGH